MNESVDVIQMSPEQIMIQLYIDSVNVVCALDVDVMKGNINLVENMPFHEDRVVPIEAATFIADNAGLLVSMIGMDYKNIRRLILTALDDEVGVDSMSAQERSVFRKKNGEDFFRNSELTIVLGATNFSSSILSELCFACERSFAAMSSCNDLIEDTEAYLASSTDEDKSYATMIFSNFVYLLRVFSHNSVFLGQMIGYINAFKKDYNINLKG